MKFKLFQAFGLTTTLAMSAGLLMMSTGKALATGQFSLTCYNIQLYAPNYSKTAKLTADCRRRDGSIHYRTSINLNDYITNNNGRLQWQPRGDFQESCYDSDVETEGSTGLYIRTFCLDRQQYPHEAYINLDEHIANINGDLIYEP